VFVITTEEDTERAYALGAVGVLTKPVPTRDALAVALDMLAERGARPHANLVIIGRDDVARHKLKVTLEDLQLVVHTPATWDEARTLLARERIDCLALDGATCEMALADLADRPGHANPPIAVFAPKGLSKRAERQVKRLAARQAVRVAQSPERLIDDTTLLLHRPFDTLPEPGRLALERLYRGDAVLAGRTVLIVDDDIRNIFAMTTVLEGCQMSVISAEGGKEGIEKLQQTPGVDIVLMDIMMPDMDGYDTMRAIRRIPAFKSLPIVAVTAKAMKGDREKCIEAGAWDYLPKPVDGEQLLSVFRTWLHR
jgi:CheY-like chemotaxis protein